MNLFLFIIFIHVNILLLSKHASGGKADNEAGPSTKRAKKANLGKTKEQIAKIYWLLRQKEKCVKHYLNTNSDFEIETFIFFEKFKKFIDKLPENIKNLHKIELENLHLNEENKEQTNSIVLEKMDVKKAEISFNDEIGLIENFAKTLMQMVTNLKIENFKPRDSIKKIIAYHVDQIYSEALNRWNGIGMALLGQLHGSLPVNLPINVQDKYTQFFISSKVAISLIGKALKVSPFLEDNMMNFEYKNNLKKKTKHLDTILHEAFAKLNIDVDSIKIPSETFEQNVQTVISDVQQMLDIENADPTNYKKYEHIYWTKCIKTASFELIKMAHILTEIDSNFDQLKTVEKIIKSAEILEKIRTILLNKTEN